MGTIGPRRAIEKKIPLRVLFLLTAVKNRDTVVHMMTHTAETETQTAREGTEALLASSFSSNLNRDAVVDALCSAIGEPATLRGLALDADGFWAADFETVAGGFRGFVQAPEWCLDAADAVWA